MQHIGKRDLALSALTGLLYPAAFMIPYAGILAWVLLIPLFLSIEKKSPWDAFRLGLLTGTLSNFIGTYWLIATLSRFGGFPIIVSAVFIVILSAYSGLAVALFSYIATRFRFLTRAGILGVILSAAVWTSIEYVFPFLFPYGISNSQTDYFAVMQIFDLFGIYSLSFVIVVVNLTLMRVFKKVTEQTRFPVWETALSLILGIATLLYGFYRIPQVDAAVAQAPKLKIGMVQANFDFLAKTESQEEVVTAKHKEMSHELVSSDLIIWPETAIQAWFSNGSDLLIVRDEMGVPKMEGKYFLVGGMSFTVIDPNVEEITNDNVIMYNTAFLTDSNGVILARYHKIKLLLFGEYLPFTKYIPALKHLSPASGDFTPGNELNIFEIKEKGARIAPIICYEDIIPEFSRKFAAKGANLIINITNDAWFGKTTAPYQHLNLSIPRAIETRRYLLRSTNTGISAIIDPVGRVVAETPIFVRTNVQGEVGLMNGNLTLYTRIGDLFPLACLLFWVGFIAVEKLRGKDVGNGA